MGKALVFTLGNIVWIIVGTVILYRIEARQRLRIEKELGKVTNTIVRYFIQQPDKTFKEIFRESPNQEPETEVES